MKILLDENIDIRFKHIFPSDYQVYTVRDMEWNGIKNGELIRRLYQHKFDCLIIVDKNLPYQQNPDTLPCLIIVLDVFRNTLKHLTALMPAVLTSLEAIREKKVIVISEPE